jgi:hypothetical protein
MEDFSYLRLEAIRLEKSASLIQLDYSLDEREGKLLYRFRIPTSKDAQSGLLPILESGYVEEGSPEVRDLAWPELPERVSRDALQWLESQREAAR